MSSKTTPTPLAPIDEIRERILAMKAELERFAHAAEPIEESLRRCDLWIDAQAARLDPIVPIGHGVSARGIRLEWPAALHNPSEVLACALHPERVRELLHAAVHRAYDLRGDGAISITAAQRTSRMRKLREALFLLESQEEQLIRDLEAAGLDIDRRGDADPAAVLGLEPRPLDEIAA